MSWRAWVNLVLLVVVVATVAWLVPRCSTSLSYQYLRCWDAQGDLMYQGHVLDRYNIDQGALSVVTADGQHLTFVNTPCILAPERQRWRNRPD